MPHFETPLQWVKHCQRLVHDRDLDNVVLFDGDPGNGKSTLMAQVGRALDSQFTEEHIHFTIKDFLADARSLPPGRAVAADELFMHRRHHATRESKEMIDFLQVCRGLNLHILLCFPHAGQIDRDILDRRVRYRVTVHRPENQSPTALLYEREFRTISDIDGQEHYVVAWNRVMKPWKFERNTGEMWERYGAKKILAARQRDAEAKGVDWTDPTLPSPSAPRNRKQGIRLQPKGRLSEAEWNASRRQSLGPVPKYLAEIIARRSLKMSPSRLREMKDQDGAPGPL